MSKPDTKTRAPVSDLVPLTSDEKHIGVIFSSVPDRPNSRVSVKQWEGHDGLITLGMFMGEHRWLEHDFRPQDAAKVAALILGKPAVTALITPAPQVTDTTIMPLKWVERPDGLRNTFEAHVFGYTFVVSSKNDAYFFWTTCGMQVITQTTQHTSLDAAKQAAQAVWEAMLRSVVFTSPDVGDDDPGTYLDGCAAADEESPQDADYLHVETTAEKAQNLGPSLEDGRFDDWSLSDFAGQCRMQARDNLDPEYSEFMTSLSKRLSELSKEQASEKALGWIRPFDVDMIRGAITGNTTAVMRERSERASVALFLHPKTLPTARDTNAPLIEMLKEVKDTLTSLAWEENHSILEKINTTLETHTSSK
jgi:hypothetical protein